jgi:hypothetical protein
MCFADEYERYAKPGDEEIDYRTTRFVDSIY